MNQAMQISGKWIILLPTDSYIPLEGKINEDNSTSFILARYFCIPLAWVTWYIGPGLEVGRQVMTDIADPALRSALQEAHAERLGLWVAVWPVTLLILSYILERKTADSLN